jgi:hypothetical protein
MFEKGTRRSPRNEKGAAGTQVNMQTLSVAAGWCSIPLFIAASRSNSEQKEGKKIA